QLVFAVELENCNNFCIDLFFCFYLPFIVNFQQKRRDAWPQTHDNFASILAFSAEGTMRQEYMSTMVHRTKLAEQCKWKIRTMRMTRNETALSKRRLNGRVLQAKWQQAGRTKCEWKFTHNSKPR
ncbi:MAG: hypothetical protein ACK8QZ_09300, partial [Anaerolineales bacterium]